MTDETLKTNAHDKLVFEPGLNSNNINVSVENGIVTLSGTIHTFFEKKLAERAVQSVRCIKGILEELRVNLDPSTQHSDKDIVEAAIQTLEWDVVIPKNKIPLTSQSEYSYVPFTTIQRDLNNYLERFLDNESIFTPTLLATVQFPRFNVVETNKEIEIKAEQPGMEEKDIKLEADKNTLIIRGEKKAKQKKKIKKANIT